MNRATFAAIIWAFLSLGIGLESGYRIGKNSERERLAHRVELAYSDGWRDAHCGPGNSCEAGDE